MPTTVVDYSLGNGLLSTFELRQLPTVWSILLTIGCPTDLYALKVKPLDVTTIIVTRDHVT